MQNNKQIELIKNYLERRVNRNKIAAETYQNIGEKQMSMVALAQAAEADAALAYLLGIVDREEE